MRSMDTEERISIRLLCSSRGGGLLLDLNSID